MKLCKTSTSASLVIDEPLLNSYFEYVRDAYRNGNRQMYTLYEWQKHPSAPPVASEREGLAQLLVDARNVVALFGKDKTKGHIASEMLGRMDAVLVDLLATRTESDT